MAASKPKKAKRPAKGASREALIQSAAELFLEKGIEKTTFADVAGRVGLSQPAVYIHFKDKMDLLEKVIFWSAGIGRAFIDSRIDPRKPALERLEAYVEANLLFFREQPVHAHSVSAMFYFGLSTEPIKSLYFQVVGLTVERIETVLIQAKHERQVEIEETRKCAEVIYQLMIGACYRATYARTNAEFNLIRDSCLAAMKALVAQKP